MDILTNIINIQSDIAKLNTYGLLGCLLKDKTTKGSIVWGTDAYSELGELFVSDAEIKPELYGVIKTRARKNIEQQAERVKKHGEVFTPLWITTKMNDYLDEVWFNRSGVFNESRVVFKKKSWKRYIDSRRMEITCGEAPYLVTRYDVSTGEMIPILERTGILDRKLRVVSENSDNVESWIKWAIRAVQATYGYEFQGDNLLIARVNVLLTFMEHLKERWKQDAPLSVYQTLINIITWNLWQMNGLTGMTPYANPGDYTYQEDLFKGNYVDLGAEKRSSTLLCKTYDWRRDNSITYVYVKEGDRPMKFDFVIGNPPYQEEAVGENKTFMRSIYNKFMDESYKVANSVELIHPARFLFNSGNTPKAWNKKMLEDSHFKIVCYEQESAKFFPGTSIKGGIAISYHDERKDFGKIGTFTSFTELNSMMKKVFRRRGFKSLSDVVITRTAYRLTDKMHADHPEAVRQLSNGHPYDMSTNIFERLPQIFFNEKPEDTFAYIKILGRENNQRTYKYIRKEYVNQVVNLEKYKVFVPAANGSGALGEVVTTPLIGEPLIGNTESFVSIGILESKEEAENLLKYIKSKFARCMLGILKVTQHNPPEHWKYVPLQNFNNNSDIDWAKSIKEIDQQLYKKYGLTKNEIQFIESHVKEMD